MKFALPPLLTAERMGRALALAAWRRQKPPQAIALDVSLHPAVAAAAVSYTHLTLPTIYSV